MASLFNEIWRFRKILWVTSKIEISQKYVGSALGSIWIFIYPVLFLSIYLFLYLVVFQVRFPGMSSLSYVVYVFSGLVPYLVIMESVSRGTLVIKENAHLIRNVIIPIDLIPVRVVMTSFLVQVPGFFLLLTLIALDDNLTVRILLLPLVFFFLGAMILGIVYFVASIGSIASDTTYIVSLVMLLLMFLSPIAFDASMVPSSLQVIIWVNPVTYPLEAIRWAMLENFDVNYIRLIIFPFLALVTLVMGSNFFVRLKGMIADNV